MNRFAFSMTTLVAGDFERTRRFYRDLLGLEAQIDSGSHIMFACGLSIWDGVFAKKLVFGSEDVEISPQFSHELCFDSRELDAAQEQLRQEGVDFVHEIMEQPWAQRVMRVRDPDGRIIEVGEPLDMTVRRVYDETGSKKRTSERTFIPESELDRFLK